MPEDRQPIEDSAGGFAPAPPVVEEPAGLAPGAATRTSGKAIASLVCGIISLLIAGSCWGSWPSCSAGSRARRSRRIPA